MSILCMMKWHRFPKWQRRGARMKLSPREMEVASLIADGFQTKEIARKLGASYSTIKTHVHNAKNKTGARNRAQLAVMIRGIA